MKTGLKCFAVAVAAAIVSSGAWAGGIVVPNQTLKPVILGPAATTPVTAPAVKPTIVAPAVKPTIVAPAVTPTITPVAAPSTKSVIVGPAPTPAANLVTAAPVVTEPLGFDFDEHGNAFVAGQAMIGFRAGTTELTARSILATLGADPTKTQWNDRLLKNMSKVWFATAAQKKAAADLARSALVFFPVTTDVLDFCKKAAAVAQVEYAHPNFEVRAQISPTDPFVTLQWGIVSSKGAANDPKNNNANLPVGKIGNFPEAWNYASGLGIRVAVIDTGCDLRHPDLINKIYLDAAVPQVVAAAYNPTPGGPDNPPITYDNVTVPRRPWDDNGHGTHVAGIIGAQWNNKIGIAGTAPNCVIVPMKALNNLGVGTLNDAIVAISTAVGPAPAGLACRVVNLSLGGTPPVPMPGAWQGVLNNVAANRAIVVAAMGNIPSTPTPPLFTLFAPACLPGVVAVSSHDYLGVRSQFSATGPWNCTAAPGGSHLIATSASASAAMQNGVLSTWPTYLPNPILGAFGAAPGYESIIGTSMAAPHVAGAAAMLIQRTPGLGSGQIWAHFARFANRATVPAVTATNPPASSVYGTAPNGTVAPVFPGYYGLIPPSIPSVKNSTAETLLLNTPHNYTLGHGLLDPYRLMAQVESPARFPGNGSIPNSVPTGHVRIFPLSPRHMFTKTNDLTSSVVGGTVLNGLDLVDRVYVPAPPGIPVFRAIMVGDRGELLLGGTLQLKFVRGIRPAPLVGGLTPFPGGVQFVNLLDNGVAPDTLANDGIYTYSFPAPFINGYVAGSSILFQYLGSGWGSKPNTNVFIGVRVF